MSEVESMTDADLVAKSRGGDRTAFDELIRRHYGVVYAVGLARLREAESAEDLAQEVFLRLYLQISALRDGTRFAAWCVCTARNLAVDWLRRGQKHSLLLPILPEVESQGDPSPGAVEMIQRKDEDALLNRALENLPAEEREMILLRFMENLTKKEIAERLGLHPSTVGRKLERTLKDMRQGLEESLRVSLAGRKTGHAGIAKAGAALSGLLALPAVSRAELLVSSEILSAQSAIVVTSAETLTPVLSQGFLVSTAAKVAAGGIIVGSGKIIAIAVAGAVLVGVGISSIGRSSSIALPGPNLAQSRGLPSGWQVGVNDSDSDTVRITRSQHWMESKAITLSNAISNAWETSETRTMFAEGITEKRKDIVIGWPAGTPQEEVNRIYRQEIQSAWNVRIRTEKQVREVLVLTAPNGKPAAFTAPKNTNVGSMRPVNGTTTVENQSIHGLIHSLETESGRPVLDETGLTGAYDYSWSGSAQKAAVGFGLQISPARREVDIVIVEPNS